MTPPAGTPLAFGDTVELVVVPVPSVTVPDVVGQELSAAEERLEESDLGTFPTRPPCTVERQDPVVHSIVPRDSIIGLTPCDIIVD